MSKKTKRQAIRARRRRARLRSNLIWGTLGVGVLAIFAFMIWNVVKPAAGEAVPELLASHVPEGSPPGPYNTDPPSSGPHYPSSLPAGFYEQADLATLPPNPEGYLMHAAEHGYVIFWYNCDVLDGASCDELKGDIQQAMKQVDNFKVIGFPWSSIEGPVVLTSWGRIQRFAEFDQRAAVRFVERNRNRAPEPNAP